MSKSLKNFVKIREMFEKGFTSNNFRIACLLTPYRSNLDFNFDLLEEARSIEKRLTTLLREICFFGSSFSPASQAAPFKRSTPESIKLLQRLTETQMAVRNHLADDFDTSSSLKKLLDLSSSIQSLLMRPDSATILPIEVLFACGRFIFDLLSVLGLDTSLFPPIHDLHKTTKTISPSFSPSSPAAPIVDLSTPLAERLAEFRSDVRSSSIRAMKLLNKDPQTSELQELRTLSKDLLDRCDDLRETFFPSIGFSLQVCPPSFLLPPLLPLPRSRHPPALSAGSPRRQVPAPPPRDAARRGRARRRQQPHSSSDKVP